MKLTFSNGTISEFRIFPKKEERYLEMLKGNHNFSLSKIL